MSYLTQLEREINELRRLKENIINDMGIDIFDKWLPHLKSFFPNDEDLKIDNWQDADSEQFKEKCIYKIQLLLSEKMKELKEEEENMMKQQLDLIQREMRSWKKIDRRSVYEERR